MRIPIREQLAALVIFASLVSLAVISIASWVTNYNRVVTLRAHNLALTASLKATQMSSNLNLMSRSVQALSTRVRLQTALKLYIDGENSTAAFASLSDDLYSALAVGTQDVLTLQAMIFPGIGQGVVGRGESLLNVTGTGVDVPLGNGAVLGVGNAGYPPALYPNLTYPTDFINGSIPTFLGSPVRISSSLLLGPYQVNSSFALISITLPVINNTSATDILGYMTVVCDARLISEVLDSSVGLGETGTMLLITPDTINNRFPGQLENDSLPILNAESELEQTLLQFAYPPYEPYSQPRHTQRSTISMNSPFNFTAYPILIQAFGVDQNAVNNANGQISTTNEQGAAVAVGYAVVQNTLCTWVLVLEESHAEAFSAIVTLRKVLLACVFATFGVIILLVLPLAHYSSRPIRRLRDATAKSLRPQGAALLDEKGTDGNGPDPASGNPRSARPKLGATVNVNPWRKPRPDIDGSRDPEALKSTYPIPQNVVQRKHFIQDELTDLTQYFNEMSDELVLHYGRLEERVKQRTAELEASKIAAEAANESKTLFIANISHELKTPLNGILGMCAVCMQEDDPVSIRRSLEIIYKSGDLLHNLLTDLLTFSKNQAGQALTLDEKEFHTRDIGTQIQAIFEKQAREGRVNLNIVYQGPRDGLNSRGVNVERSYGPLGTGRVKDMALWGDYHRILQVVINLVSNSLKFTPEGGSVQLTIRCMDEITAEVPQSRRSSELSTSSNKKRRRIRLLTRSGSDADTAPSDESRLAGLAELSKQISQVSQNSVAPDSGKDDTPLPLNSRNLLFEFEVEDTGPGIAENLQQKIFEPFVQGDLRLTKKFGGTGLGLSICQQLAKLMSGTIGLQSELGRGSTFVLKIPLRHLRNRVDSTATSTNGSLHALSRVASLVSIQQGVPARTQTPANIPNSPIKQSFDSDTKPRLIGLSQPYFSSAQAPMASPDATPGKRKLKILVAEDNKVNQEVVLRMLRLEEVFDVTVAQDGQEALELVQQSVEAASPYDLILMDVMMPRLGGHDSTRMIRDLGFSAPIVALTAFTDEVNEKQCKDSGMDYFLAKPLRRPALKHVLNTFCPTIREVDESETRSGDVSPMGPGIVQALTPAAEEQRLL